MTAILKQNQMIRLLLFSFFILQAAGLFGQTDSVEVRTPRLLRHISVFSSLKKFQAILIPREGEEVFFENHNLDIGVRFRYWNIQAALALPVFSFGESLSEETTAYNAVFFIYPKAFFVQGDARYFKGSYYKKADETVSFRGADEILTTSLELSYLFNHRNFSLNSAINMAERQLESGGSWLITLPFSYQYYKTDSLLVLAESGDFEMDSYEQLSVGLAGGYGYSKVFSNWCATLAGGVGSKIKFAKIENKELEEVLDFSLKHLYFRALGSVIYYKGDYFCGIVGQYNPSIGQTKNLELRRSDWRFRLMFGKKLFKK